MLKAGALGAGMLTPGVQVGICVCSGGAAVSATLKAVENST